MLRYMRRLEARDLSLTTSMIPLGSCTMKLNATVGDAARSPGRSSRGCTPSRRPTRPQGYQRRCSRSSRPGWREITGFAAVSLQPNAGSQGEYAGLLAIRAYHESRGEGAPQRLPDPRLRARHQSRQRGDGRASRSWRSPATRSGNIDVADLAPKAAGAPRPTWPR